MKTRRETQTSETAQIFDQAVRERALAVVTIHDGRDWITYKSRFLERDPARQFFVLDHRDEHDCPHPTAAPGHYVGISLRHRSRKVMFATVIEARGHYQIESGEKIPAVRYRWPDSTAEFQRRAYHRTELPENTNLLVSLWPGGIAARQSAQRSTLQVVNGRLADISCGGTRIVLSQDSPPDWSESQTLGLEIQLEDGGAPIQLDAHYRGVRPDSAGKPAIAVQFVGLELSDQGRSILTRIAGLVQRYHRQGIASGREVWHTQFEQE